MLNPESALFFDQVLAFRPKCRIKFGRGNVIQVVAHRLESDADKNLKYLILTVSCGKEVLDRLRFHMSALSNHLPGERDQRRSASGRAAAGWT